MVEDDETMYRGINGEIQRLSGCEGSGACLQVQDTILLHCLLDELPATHTVAQGNAGLHAPLAVSGLLELDRARIWRICK